VTQEFSDLFLDLASLLQLKSTYCASCDLRPSGKQAGGRADVIVCMFVQYASSRVSSAAETGQAGVPDVRRIFIIIQPMLRQRTMLLSDGVV